MIEREQIRDREAKNRRRSEYVEVEKRKIEKDPSRDRDVHNRKRSE